MHDRSASGRSERCPECGARAISAVDGCTTERAMCRACFAQLRRSLADGHWKVQIYGAAIPL